MKGTDPTPPQLTARQSLTKHQNVHRLQLQLRQQGASVETIIQFAQEADRVDGMPHVTGQIEPIATAARSVGAAVHWIN